MAGMLQILTYLLAFYLIVKGIEVLQIGLASSRADRSGLILIGVLTLFACGTVAVGIVLWQDQQAQSISQAVRP